jgi:tetratricopeptide (TPR) repeat protein
MLKPYLILLLAVLFLMPIFASAQVINTPSGEGLSKAEYAAVLAAEVTAFYYNKRWQDGFDAAQKAIAVDSMSYSRNVNWDMAGACRFKVKDYAGAVIDLSHFVVLKNQDRNRMTEAVEYKAQAHIVLGQLVNAAQTYEYWDEHYGHNTTGPQQAAVLYKGAGNKSRFDKLLATALTRCKYRLDSINAKSKNTEAALNYAELLIIAGKPAQAIGVLENDPAHYSRTQLSIKKYLLAAAYDITGRKPYALLNKQLKDWIYNNTLVNTWDFNMFDRWIAYSDLSKTKQLELKEFQDIIEDKY